jgi:hypothetical protein
MVFVRSVRLRIELDGKVNAILSPIMSHHNPGFERSNSSHLAAVLYVKVGAGTTLFILHTILSCTSLGIPSTRDHQMGYIVALGTISSLSLSLFLAIFENHLSHWTNLLCADQ